MSIRKILALCVVASSAVAVSVAAAAGRSPSTAADLPLGVKTSSAGTGYDMWRVLLQPGDQLVMNVGNNLATRPLYACVLDAGVTDYNYSQRPCYMTPEDGWFELDPSQKQEWVLNFRRPPGTYILVFYYCCGTSDDGPEHRISDPPSTSPFDYDLTAFLRASTAITMKSNASVVRTRGKITLSGKLTSRIPLTGSKVAVQSWSGSKWTTLALKTVSATGGYKVVAKAPAKVGRVRYRVIYYGDDGHVASSAGVVVRVV